jgi:hypothetical protein
MNKKLKIAFIFICATCFTVVSKAQEYTPKQCSWGVTLDVSPFIKRVADFNAANAPLYTSRITNNPSSILVKYFLKDNVALRTKFRVGYTSTTINSLIPDAANTNPIDVVYLEENVKINQYNIGIFGGLEKRKTAGRVQGIYGGEMGISFGQGFTYEYYYANPILIDNPTPESTDYSSQLGVQNITSTTRVLENNQGYNFSFIARGILGAEFFVAQNFSLGFEYAWGVDLSSTKDATVKEEFWDAANATLATREMIYKGKTSFGLDNHELLISVNLYF